MKARRRLMVGVFCIAAVLMPLTACSEQPIPTTHQLVGTWRGAYTSQMVLNADGSCAVSHMPNAVTGTGQPIPTGSRPRTIEAKGTWTVGSPVTKQRRSNDGVPFVTIEFTSNPASKGSGIVFSVKNDTELYVTLGDPDLDEYFTMKRVG